MEQVTQARLTNTAAYMKHIRELTNKQTVAAPAGIKLMWVLLQQICQKVRFN